MEWRMKMKTMEKRRKRLPQPRRGEGVRQQKPKKLRVRTKKSFLQQSPRVRAEDGLLARRPKKRKRMKMRMKRLLPRRPPVEGVHQAKRRKRQCTRRTVKKTTMEAIQSLRWWRTRGARMTLIQKLLQRRQRRLPQRRSRQERGGRRVEGGHQDQQLRRRKSLVQSTTSMISPTPRLSPRRGPTIPGTRTTDRTLPTPG